MSRGTEMERIVSSLRTGVLDDPGLGAELLADHLLGRLAEFRDLLEYVGDATDIGDAAATLRFTQYRADAKAGLVGLAKSDQNRQSQAQRQTQPPTREAANPWNPEPSPARLEHDEGIDILPRSPGFPGRVQGA